MLLIKADAMYKLMQHRYQSLIFFSNSSIKVTLVQSWVATQELNDILNNAEAIFDEHNEVHFLALPENAFKQP